MQETAGRERPDVRPGDSAARITAFFDAALDVVYPYLSRRCGGDRSLVEDLTQETFVAAVRTLRLDLGVRKLRGPTWTGEWLVAATPPDRVLTFDVVIENDVVILAGIELEWERTDGGWNLVRASYCRFASGVGIDCPATLGPSS